MNEIPSASSIRPDAGRETLYPSAGRVLISFPPELESFTPLYFTGANIWVKKHLCEDFIWHPALDLWAALLEATEPCVWYDVREVATRLRLTKDYQYAHRYLAVSLRAIERWAASCEEKFLAPPVYLRQRKLRPPGLEFAINPLCLRTEVEELSYDKAIFKLWREARIKFIETHPATAKALALKTPNPAGDNHTADANCWCGPKAVYDPETDTTVYVHHRVQ